jgi:hypothetical protein
MTLVLQHRFRTRPLAGVVFYKKPPASLLCRKIDCKKQRISVFNSKQEKSGGKYIMNSTILKNTAKMREKFHYAAIFCVAACFFFDAECLSKETEKKHDSNNKETIRIFHNKPLPMSFSKKPSSVISGGAFLDAIYYNLPLAQIQKAREVYSVFDDSHYKEKYKAILKTCSSKEKLKDYLSYRLDKLSATTRIRSYTDLEPTIKKFSDCETAFRYRYSKLKNKFKYDTLQAIITMHANNLTSHKVPGNEIVGVVMRILCNISKIDMIQDEKIPNTLAIFVSLNGEEIDKALTNEKFLEYLKDSHKSNLLKVMAIRGLVNKCYKFRTIPGALNSCFHARGVKIVESPNLDFD